MTDGSLKGVNSFLDKPVMIINVIISLRIISITIFCHVILIMEVNVITY